MLEGCDVVIIGKVFDGFFGWVIMCMFFGGEWLVDMFVGE